MAYRLPLVQVSGTRAATTRAVHEAAINQSLAHVAGLPVAGVRVVGEWAASSGAFPAASVTGYAYIVTDDGTVGGEEFFAGDRLLAMIDAPSTTVYAANWLRVPEPAGTEPIVYGSDTVAGLAAVNLARFAGAATLGRGMAGDGGGAAYLRTVSAVRGGFADQSLDTWGPSFDNIIRPETFGAKGDDPDFDDSTGIQNMFEAGMENGHNGFGVLSFSPGKYYYCGDAEELIVDSGFVSVEGNNAYLSFARKTCTDPATFAELLTSSSFGSSTGWTGFSDINSDYEDWVITGGQAVYEGTQANLGKYGGLFQARTLTQGKWYRVRVLLSFLTFGGTPGNPTQQYCTVGFRHEGPDAGGGNTRTYGGGSVGSIQTFDFKWTQPTGTAWFQIKSNNPVTADFVSVKELPRNAGILCDGDYSPFAMQYAPTLGSATWRNLNIAGHDPNWWGQYPSEPDNWIGRNDTTTWLHGIGMLWNCDRALFRTEMHMRDVGMEGFDVCVQTANQTYICDWIGGRVLGGTHAVVLGEGNDAGENMRFNHLTMSQFRDVDGAAAFYNQGRYSHLYGCSIDYFNRAAIRLNGGYTHLTNCHIEKSSPAQAQNYIFNIEGGTLILHNGYMQLNRRVPPVLEHIFKLGSSARVIVDGMQGFGIETATGAIATGGGAAKSKFRWSGIGQKAGSPFVTRTEDTSLIPYKSHVTLSGETIDQWDYCVVGGSRVNAKETGFARAERLTTGERTSGRKGVKITKLGGPGNNVTFQLAIPCPSDGMVSSEFYVKILPNAGPASDSEGNLYIDYWMGQLIGDPKGVFALAEGRRWRGEYNVARNVNWNAGQDWTQVLANGAQNTNAPTWGDEFGSEARSHLVLYLNMADFPVDTEVQICDLMAEVL